MVNECFPFLVPISTLKTTQLIFNTLDDSPTPSSYTWPRTRLMGKFCVKFVQQYNVTAHKLLAKIALAPQLLHCSEVANGQFRMVVMDFVEGETAYERFGATQKVADPIVEQVKRAIDELHQNPLVFGDLRRPNVVIMKDGKAKLVDFDWCGEDGKGRYPPTLNDPSSINWHADVKRDGIMSKVHDEHMIATF